MTYHDEALNRGPLHDGKKSLNRKLEQRRIFQLQSSARYFSLTEPNRSRIPQGERKKQNDEEKTERRTVKDDENFQNVQLIESGLKIRAKLGYRVRTSFCIASQSDVTPAPVSQEKPIRREKTEF